LVKSTSDNFQVDGVEINRARWFFVKDLKQALLEEDGLAGFKENVEKDQTARWTNLKIEGEEEPFSGATLSFVSTFLQGAGLPVLYSERKLIAAGGKKTMIS
jgi:hypothetical protein